MVRKKPIQSDSLSVNQSVSGLGTIRSVNQSVKKSVYQTVISKLPSQSPVSLQGIEAVSDDFRYQSASQLVTKPSTSQSTSQ